MTRRRPFSEDMPGGHQLRLFDEDTGAGPATTAGPAPGEVTLPTIDTDPETPRTEPQP
ncbi:hypothetical protein [Streptomyces sp. NBC_00576]|uniref:hypothetical protein n=1 Tax=Streptomyces sp. NBC_00576 TaxID=2903665 RepID=UPI002E81B864|nr:hypothetical protein [Streptomyces sp. NBC_00576]WUB77698.1 hypothetical protein OG734_47580 [Streptomyces sp. NBC_00576]